jgi:glycosyltransferase involved in cell wall biosynthesis
MNFAIVIPTRKDRPKFIEQCKKLIRRQTLQPKEVIWVDYAPTSNHKDITQRYRKGVEDATKKGYDFVVFWEDDDWYHPRYLEWLVGEWEKKNKPNFFGVGETYYYHLLAGKSHHMQHNGRTSAFCTLVKLPWRIVWPADNYAFLDMHISKHSQVITINFPKEQVYAIGIKHGTGLTGGGGHNTSFPYNNQNAKSWFLSQISGDRDFYESILQELGTPINTKGTTITNQPNNIPRVNERSNIQKREITPLNSNTQLHRRSTKFVKIHKK